MNIYDRTPCQLGEGPLWHPLREELFWFDIVAKTMYNRRADKLLKWTFDEYVSAAGWIDVDHLLIASETALIKFNVMTGKQVPLCPLEAHNAVTRSNDGRADPWGGFWIGTMGINAQPKAGAIYRFYQGELRKIHSDITISNAICFSPDAQFGYHTDTAEQKIMRTPLNKENGWPIAEPQLFIDFSQDDLNPDGAVCDAQGNIWIAQWGASRVAQYSAQGLFMQAVSLPTAHITCPAFGGPNFNQLFITTAQQDLTPSELAEQDAGMTFSIELNLTGLPESQVSL